MDDLLSTRDVARLAGVGPTAVKRWADAQLLPSVRTAGGHRRFPRTEVERFLRERGNAGAEGASWTDRLLGARDALAVEGLLLLERSRTRAWWRVADLVGEALRELGERWAEGIVTIGEEHLASARLARALGRVSETYPLPADAPRALLVCMEGEDHTLGLSLAELTLREAGWSTTWVGRATPIAELRRLVLAGEHALVGVSASAFCTDAAALAEFARQAGEACAAVGAVLILGGAAPWPEQLSAGLRLSTLEELHAHALAERRRRRARQATRPTAGP